MQLVHKSKIFSNKVIKHFNAYLSFTSICFHSYTSSHIFELGKAYVLVNTKEISEIFNKIIAQIKFTYVQTREKQCILLD